MNEDMVAVPYDQVALTMLKANIELLQRVNRLIELLEKQTGIK
jgi:hypothetical protein